MLLPLLLPLVLVKASPAPDALDVVPYPRGRRVRVAATRVSDGEIKIDGRVEESAWETVDTLPELIQIAPRFGAAPTHRTVVRVAYGDRGLYVAFVCHDDPEHVRGAVARKDQIPPSDRVAIAIDPNHDHTNGFHFGVNPSGAQQDAQISRDGRHEFLWDGVWTAAARKHDRGWSAEIFVPWSTLRFEKRESNTFGINVERQINHDGEHVRLSPTPQGLPGFLSWSSDYEGVEGVSPGLNFELRPYVSGRFAVRRAPGSLDQSWRALPNSGIEGKYGLLGNVTLDVAVNPDFGQAEVDPAVLNLSPFEVFFQERRQTFLEAKGAFEGRFQLFYSRRVGNNPRGGRADLGTRVVHGEEEQGELVELQPQTRILDLVRVTGEPTPGWRVGAFTATTGPTFGVERYSDGSEQPVTVDPVTQYSVARLRRRYDSRTHVGGIVTAVNRGGNEPDAFTGGMDYQVQFRRRWTHSGEVIGTHDGEDAGMGASSDLERTGKNSFVELRGKTLNPTANFNDLGFMTNADFSEADFEVKGFNAQPLGRIRRLEGGTTLEGGTNYDGLITRKGVRLRTSLESMGLWRVGTFGGINFARMDPWETRGGIPWEVPLHWWIGGEFRTPYNRRVVFNFNTDYGVMRGVGGIDIRSGIDMRPVDRLQIGLSVDYDTSIGRPRWVTTSDDGEPVFGNADVYKWDVVLRGTLGITPTLSLQSYNQLLYSTAHHDRFFILDDPRILTPTAAAPYFAEVDQALTAFTSNSIARWEYWPGSFLFLVYTHRTVLDSSGMLATYRPRDSLWNLGHTGATHEDTIFLKLVHLFGF